MSCLLRWTVATILLLEFTALLGDSQQAAAAAGAPGGMNRKRPDGAKPIDDYQSHFPLDVERPQDLEAALKHRLAMAKEMSQFKDLFKSKQLKLDPEKINELLKKLPHDLDSLKNLNQQAQQALQGDLMGGPGQSKQLEEWIQKLNNLPDPPKDLENLVPPQNNNPTDPLPKDLPVVNPSPAPAKPSERMAEFITKHLTKTANWLEKSGYDEDGSTLKEALRHLSSMKRGDTSFFLENVKGLVDRFEGVGRFFSPEKLGLGNLSPIPKPDWKFTLPSMPHVDLPALSPPSLGTFPSAPSFSTPEAPSLLVWCSVLLFLGVLAWKLPAWMREENKEAATLRNDSLGPWPVAPNAVHTRGELIRAFEYLSLLILGPSARTDNHNDLAQRLGADLVDHQEAARCLARLYEESRYAPEQSQPETPLPEQDQVAARQALCLLAGVTGP